jgi:hypothetical protein
MDYRGYGRVVVLSQKWRMGLQKEEDPGMTGKNPWLPVDVPGNSSKPLIGGAGSRVYGDYINIYPNYPNFWVLSWLSPSIAPTAMISKIQI